MVGLRMELRHLRYFIAVAEEENVSRAAMKLHVSQPGISRQIRDLEEEIGFDLFERTAKSIKLTTAGKIFLKEARAILQRTEDAVQNARAAVGGSGELHVGYAPSLTARFLPQTLRAFQEALPKVRVKLHDSSTEEMSEGLRTGKLQISFTVRVTQGAWRDFNFAELSRDRFCVAVAPKHRLASKRSVKLEDIAREPLVIYSRKDYPEAYKSIVTLFSKLKVKPRIAEEHDSVSSLIAAVEAGTGISIATGQLACTAGWRLKLIPFSPPLDPLIIGAAWKGKLTQSAEKFLTCAKQFASNK